MERTPFSSALACAVPAIRKLAVAVAQVALLITLVRRNFDLGVAGALSAVGARRRKSLDHCCAIASDFLGQPSAAQRLPAALCSLKRLAQVFAFWLRAGRHRAPQSRARDAIHQRSGTSKSECEQHDGAARSRRSGQSSEACRTFRLPCTAWYEGNTSWKSQGSAFRADPFAQGENRKSYGLQRANLRALRSTQRPRSRCLRLPCVGRLVRPQQLQGELVSRLARTQAPPQRGHAAGRRAARWRGVHERRVARVVRRLDGATSETEPGSTSFWRKACRRRARRRVAAPAPAAARERLCNLRGRGGGQAGERLRCEASAHAPGGTPRVDTAPLPPPQSFPLSSPREAVGLTRWAPFRCPAWWQAP